MRVDLEPIEPVIDEPKRPPDLPAKSPQAGKPPAVGDWVMIGDYIKPQKILRIEPKRGWDDEQLWIKDGWYYPKSLHKVVRLRDAPLEKGDRGLLDGKIEVWIDTVTDDKCLWLVFGKRDVGMALGATGVDYALVALRRFTLTEPVYQPKED